MPIPVDIEFLSPEQDYLLAQLSEYSEYLSHLNYGNGPVSLNDLFNKIHDDSLKNLLQDMINKGLGSIKIKAVDYKSNTNFGALCFVDDYGHTGFSFKPTKDIKDLGHDINIILTGSSEENEQAKAFFEANMDKSNHNNFLFGYSLGGNLALSVYREYAQYVGKVNIFNALPIKDWIMTEEDKARINQWVKEGDNIHIIDSMLRTDMSIDHSNEDKFDGKEIRRDSGIGWFFGDHTNKVGKWFDDNGNPIGGYPPIIEVDSWKLRDYGMRLEKVQQRVYDLENKIRDYNNPFTSLDTTLLKLTNNLINQFMQFFTELEMDFNNYADDFNIGKYCSYLFWTSEEIERIEQILSSDLGSLE